MKKLLPAVLLLTLVFSGAGCAGNLSLPTEATSSPAPTDPPPPSPTPTLPPSPTPLPTPLSPEPQEVIFTSGDGFELAGTYYPGNRVPSPVLVLMHWYPGDQTDWTEIAYWLQNRGLSGPGGDVPWRDSAWFPSLPEGQSYAVFTFTFRGCQGGCRQADHQNWLLDARAGVQRASRLPGVDPHQIAAAGASIGADGAAAGCAAALESSSASCLGAFSLSPGNYLTNHYQEDLQTLGSAQPPRPVWCLYDVNDHTADLCKELSGDHFSAQSYSGGYLHGMHLLNPDLEPNPLELMLEFLGETLSDQ